MKKQHIVEVTVLIFITIFIYTGLSKLFDHRTFIYSIGWLKQLRPAANFISYFFPILEIVIAILLFTNRYKKIGLIASMILMIIFIYYIIFMKIHASSLPCSCGGIISQLTWDQHLILNTFLVCMAALSLLIIKKKVPAPVNNHYSE